MNQEHIMQLQMIEQEAEQLNKQVELIEQNIAEMQELRESLIEIENKDNKEILANLGKKIYIPVEIKDKNLIVEVGNKTFVKKTIPETREIINKQIERLVIGKSQIAERLEALQKDMEKTIEDIQKNENKHIHGEECRHE
jgi:prefoldin alpha subunit